jgi:protein PhnA
MPIQKTLMERSGSKCELCSSTDDLQVYDVPPTESTPNSDRCVLICGTCKRQIEQPSSMNINHWRCLNDCMWSQVPAVQVMAWRLLNVLSSESWAQEALDMIYMENDTMEWAKTALADDSIDSTLDINGHELKAGDNVVLIKDLVVKGANFTAKRGTAVRGISLTNNPAHIEGRINGTRIVIIAEYVKKS